MAIASLMLKDVASYDAVGATMTDIKKLNYLFGYNGSGKSTLSRMLYDYSRPQNERKVEYQHCSVTGYNDAVETILVFNEDFVKQNFIAQDSQRGIFSLNKANKDIDDKIIYYNGIISEAKMSDSKCDLRKINLDQWIINKKKSAYDSVFAKREQFKLFYKEKLQYSGNKEQNFNHVRTFLSRVAEKKTIDELVVEYEKIYTRDLTLIPELIKREDFEKLCGLYNSLSNSLNQVIVGGADVDISAMISELNNSVWVEQGIPLLERSSGRCPFCQQEIVGIDKFVQSLNAFFNKSYTEKIANIKRQGNELYQVIQTLIENLKNLQNYTSIKVEANTLYGRLSDIWLASKDIIYKKLQSPNEKYSLVDMTSLELNAVFESFLSAIEENNNYVKNYSQMKKSFVDQCWILLAAESKSIIEDFDAKVERIDRIRGGILLLKEKNANLIAYASRQISWLRTQTINTTQAVENINALLKRVGFNDFYISEIKNATGDSRYKIKRRRQGQDTFTSFSEGERNFIAFLYFYQLCLGIEDVNSGTAKKKIIVIDDPISSMDSQIMFTVSTLIHQLIRYKDSTNPGRRQFANNNIEQVFILTHNMYFYKEVSLTMRPICSDNAFYLVSKNLSSVSKIEKQQGKLIHDDYYMMWNSLKRLKNEAFTNELIIVASNLMRRIIDTYMKFIGYANKSGNITWHSIDKLQENTPEYIVCHSFISMINDDSHEVGVFDSNHYSVLALYNSTVLFRSFELLFETIGKEHYDMMMN